VEPNYDHDGITIYLGDCLAVLRGLPPSSTDAIVTDPPYGLAFMGKRWDYDVPAVAVWEECLRVLKPGGHLLAFAGTRTQHRMAVNIEDAGFEIRDMIAWVYGSGFPKSLDVSKAIDKRGGAQVAWFGPWFRKWREDNGVTQKQVAALFPSKTGGLTGCVANWELGLNMPTPEQFNLIRDTFSLPFASIEEAEREVVGQDTKARSTSGKSALPTIGGNTVYETWAITAPSTDAAKQWEGWGTALKPALEPITVARKPLVGTVAENVLAHGTGAINVDGCRVGMTDEDRAVVNNRSGGDQGDNEWQGPPSARPVGARFTAATAGRWPANLIHDGSDEVVGLFPQTTSGRLGVGHGSGNAFGVGNNNKKPRAIGSEYGNDSGSAARFFYCAKASKADRDEGCEGLEERKAGSLNMRTDAHSERNGMNTEPRRNGHPTVKPTALMRYLCRLVTPPGGVVLDPFMGSGSTGKAAVLEGFRFIGIEREAEYVEIARTRIHAAGKPRQGGLL